MSYSRWGDSHWYTYWAVSRDGIPETVDNAIFEICGIAAFAASDLRDSLEFCISLVVEECKNPRSPLMSPSFPSVEQLTELRGYIAEFLADVDAKYRVACVV